MFGTPDPDTKINIIQLKVPERIGKVCKVSTRPLDVVRKDLLEGFGRFIIYMSTVLN